MPTVVITGTNRGLGFEYLKQYAADGSEESVTASKRLIETLGSAESGVLRLRRAGTCLVIDFPRPVSAKLNIFGSKRIVMVSGRATASLNRRSNAGVTHSFDQ